MTKRIVHGLLGNYNTQIALIHTCSTQVGKEFGKSLERVGKELGKSLERVGKELGELT